jgi:hypothetical protein
MYWMYGYFCPFLPRALVTERQLEPMHLCLSGLRWLLTYVLKLPGNILNLLIYICASASAFSTFTSTSRASAEAQEGLQFVSV